VVIRGPANDISGTLKGLELAHQQVYDFLPGLLSGVGTQFSYTYVDASDFPNPNISGIGSPSVNSSGGPVNNGPFVAGTPLQGVSEPSATTAATPSSPASTSKRVWEAGKVTGLGLAAGARIRM
jgi:hypothetical protein